MPDDSFWQHFFEFVSKEIQSAADGRGKLDEIIDRLKVLKLQGDRLMALVDDLKAAIAQLDAETTKVADRIDLLVGQLAAGTLSDAEKADVMGALQAELARLRTLAADTGTPVPPEPATLKATRAKRK